jgi:AcrR family transcriptional regulator
MRRKNQQRGQESRDRLLSAAEECFAQHGYEATGVAEICRHAGLSKGAFYHHFASKQALFMELLSRWLGRLDGQLADIRTATPSVAASLDQMAQMLQRIFDDASGQLPIFIEFMDQAMHDPVIWKATIAPYRRYRAFFAEMIAQGIAEGSLRQVDPDLAANMLVSLAVGILLQGVLDPDGPDWSRVAQASVELLVLES